MATTLTPREQGDLGELSAMHWLVEKGAHVFIPVGHSPDVDLVAQIKGELIRVEVKTSARNNRLGRWEVQIATRGGNQSWSGEVKKFDPGRCDYLFAHVGDGRRWLIPTLALGAGTAIHLGGPKYSEYEIEPGSPLRRAGTNSLESPFPRGGIPKRSNGMHCKCIGSAFAGSNPAPPIPAATERSVRPTNYERALGKRGQATVGRKRGLTVPQKPFFEAGLQSGSKVSVRAEGPGRIVIEQIELPSWAGEEAPRTKPDQAA